MTDVTAAVETSLTTIVVSSEAGIDFSESLLHVSGMEMASWICEAIKHPNPKLIWY